MNRGKWKYRDEYSGVTGWLTLESIMDMDEEFYKQNIQPRFFYLSPDELWKWKVNVLNFMIIALCMDTVHMRHNESVAGGLAAEVQL